LQVIILPVSLSDGNSELECARKMIAIPVGAGLARDADGAVFQVDRVDIIAGKPAPTLTVPA